MRRSGITKVGELLEKSDDDLLALRSFGQKSLEEVKERLEALGLRPAAEEKTELREGEADEVEEEEEKD